MKKIDVALKNQTYSIFYEKGLLKSDFIINFCKKISSAFVIITHENIKDLFAEPLLKKFEKENLKVKIISFPDGEKNKTRQTKEFIENEMLKNNFAKDSLIIAIGGGIVSDVAGFVAATYMRQIPYVVIPTTLLAMVDASIGGKTALNTEYGKNLIGSIYHPKAVFLDFNVLKTLKKEEIQNGLAEMLKHALVSKKETFYTLLNFDEIKEEMILDSIEIKKEFVQKDENDISIRRALNFGHTIGHAIEAGSNYAVKHGQAVSMGILIESYLSYLMKFLSLKEFNEIVYFLKKKKLLNNFINISKEKIFNYLQRDKKNVLGQCRFILLTKIGRTINNVEIIKNYILKSINFAFGGKHANCSYNWSRSFFSKKTNKKS